MQEKAFLQLGNSFSRFIIPYYLKPTCKGGMDTLFSGRNWVPYERKTVYLTKYIQEIFNAETNEICSFYRLKKGARCEAGLQTSETVFSAVSQIMRGRCEEFSFRIDDIWAAHFATGIGFLMLDVSHGDDETLQNITDKSFVLSNIFSARKIEGTDELNLRFFYSVEDKEIECPMAEAIRDILQEDVLQGALQIFPTSTRSKLCSYHRIARERRDEKDGYYVQRLNRGVHSTAFVQDEKSDFWESDFEINVTKSTSWNTCANGAVSLIYDDAENHEFLTNVYPHSVENDYFLVLLLVLHEREILLWYNYQIVRNWDNPKKLVILREELVQFKLWFSYNTVSIEMSYQSFYECLYRAFKLEKLENDVQEVIDKVSDYVTTNKEKKLNGILAVVAVLAVVSVFGDAMGLVDRFYTTEYPFELMHLITIIVLCAVILISVLLFLKGNRMKRRRKSRRKGEK